MARPVRSISLAVLAVLALALAGAVGSAAASMPAAKRPSLGRRLVDRFFTELQQHDVAGLRALLSPAFQVQRADGSRIGKAAYLRHLSTIRSFKIRNLTTTSNGSVLVDTYEVSADEVVNGKLLQTAYAPRLSVFIHATGWQLAAHANFNAPK
jgi:hypothetical protein